MKKQLPTERLTYTKSLVLLLTFFVFNVASLFAQDPITLNKVAIESALCNQFDITLTITGDAPDLAQDVILIIDRSGSMQGDPFDEALNAAEEFVNTFFLPANNPTGNNRVGIVSYSTSGNLEIGLTTNQAAIINEINNGISSPSGGTNIARAMDVADNEMTANGHFDCATGRSMILLTDGVTNRTLSGSSCSGTPSPPFPAGNTACMNDAINEGQGAQTTTISSVVYDQTIFSVGLFGDISGNAQAAATYTLDQIQNGGLFTTENAVDLTGIYNTILGQIALAAKDAVVTDMLGAGFQMVPGSLSDPVNASYNGGTNTITWDVGDVSSEVLTLEYSIEAIGMQGCGMQDAGMSEMTFINAICEQEILPFPNPEVCVPCPIISDPSIDQVDCSKSVDYSATFNPGECTPFSVGFVWEFFLNNVSVGTVSGNTMGDLSGTFTYTGASPFQGDFRAELTYNGTYNNNCNLPPVMVDSNIQIYLPPDAPMSGGDQAECAASPIQTLTASASVLANQTVVWYDQATNGNVVTPTWSTIGSITYYAETVDNTSNCSSLDRTPVTLTLYNCLIAIEKTATNTTTQNCNPIAPGQSINYDFTVTNQGNIAISSVEVNDPLIDPVNPIPGPALGDTNNNSILDVGEVWTYTASYVVQQSDIINGQVVNTAEVDGTVTGSSSSFNVHDEDTETVALCQDAEISITKASTSATGNCINFDVNDTIEYTFVVTNEGDVDISNVVVTDPILGGVIAGPASGDSNNDSILNVGEVWNYTASYSVTQADIDNGSIVNTAEVDGDTALGAVNDPSNQVTVTICQTPAIAIVKTNDQIPGQNNCVDLSEGDTVTYTFTVTNQGNLSIDNVVVTDPLAGLSAIAGPTGDTGNDGILGITEVWVYTATYVVTQADVDAGQITNQATVNGQAMNPANTPVTDLSGSSIGTDDATVVVICQDADIAIVKTSDQIPGQNNCVDLSEGDTVTYTFTVTNQGNLSIDNVVVTDPLAGLSAIAGPTGDTGNDGILGLTEVWVYTATYVVTQADVDAGQITNQATVNGQAMNPANTPVTDLSGSSIGTDDATVVVICQDADIAIVKTSDQNPTGGNNCVDLSEGDTVTYTFTVTNQGNLSIDNVVVTDPLAGLSAIAGPTGDTGNDGILGLTEVWVYTATYVVTQADVDAGQITNQATVNGLAMNPANTPVTDLSGSSIGTDDATVVVICQDADIAIVKTSDQIPGANNCVDLSEGDTVTYTFTVTNQGNLSIDNVVVTDPLAGLSAIAGPTGDTGNDGILGLTEVWVYTATYVVTQGDVDAGQITNQATVNGLAMNPANTPVTDLSGSSIGTDDATVVVICQDADIAIVKTSDQIPGQNNCVDLSEGDTVTYTFTVTNQGNLSIDNVVVTDPLAGLSAIAGPTGDTGNDGILGLTEVWVYTATYVVTQADVDAGQITNQATVNGQAMNPANTPVTDLSGSSIGTDDATVVVICQDADIAIVKTSDQIPGANNCVDLSEGDTVTYTFTVTNQGNLSIDNVVVTDPLAGLSAIAGPTGDTGNDGILGLTEVWVYTATYVVTQADVDAGQITNQATVNGLAMNPANTPVTDLSGSSIGTDDATVVVICQDADIAIVKTSDQIPGQNNCVDLSEGDTVTYTFTVTNQGNLSIDNVVVTDPLAGLSAIAGPTGDTGNDGILGLTEVWVYTATYVVTQADVDAGQITNQATVNGLAMNPANTPVTDLSGSSIGTDDATVVVICQDADIAIVKTSDQIPGANNCVDLSEGDTVTYTFTVTNQGNLSIDNVVVTDPLAGLSAIAGPTGDTGNDGILGLTEVWVYTATYVVTQADVDAGQITNQATVNGLAMNPANTPVTDLSGSSIGTDDATVVVICQDADIAIVKTSDQIPGANNCVDLSEGDTVTYTFTVTNQGNLSIDNVVVTDPLAGLSAIAGPTGDTGNDGILGLTEVWVYTATYVVTQADVDAGQITNQATVNGLAMNPANTPVTDLSGSSIGTDDATVVVICQDADIAIVKTSDQIPGQNNCVDLSEGDTVTYTFTVTNQGNLSIDNVVVTDPLAGLSAIAGPTGDTGNDGILGLTEVWVYTATYVVTQADVDAGQITNQATVNGLAMNPANTPVTDLSGSSIGTDDATVVVICQDADIAIVKTSDQIPGANNCVDLSEGDTVTYTFTVTNQGNLSIDNVVVTDPLAGLSAIAGPTGDTGNDGILGLTEVWVYTATYVVTQADVDAGQITNQATVNGLAMNPANTPVTDLSGSSIGTDDATVVVICQDADIAIVKTNDQIPGQNNCVDLSEGDTVTYTFTVTNQGNLSIDNVVVTDPLAGLSAIAGPTGDTGNDGILGITEVWVYTATYVVTQADVDAGQITNQATVNGQAMNPANTPVTDLSGSSIGTDDATVVVICQDADIAIVKTSDQIPGQNNCVDLSEGDTVTYTFTVTNQGNLSIDNVVVTDPLAGLSAIAGPTGDTGNDGILGLTEVWVYTATYVVTQGDVDAGQITNQATVNGQAMNPANTPVTDLSGSSIGTDDATVVVICQDADIAIVKTSDQNPTGGNNCVDLSEGDTVTYTFTVTNQGNLSIDNVVVTDPLAGLSAIAGPTGDTGNDGILGLTEVWVYTATYVVTQADVDAGQITNQATVNGLAMNPANTPVTDLSGSSIGTDDATVVVICQDADIAIVKTSDQNPTGGNNCVDLSEGDTVTYTFTVTNQGNLSIDNVVVTDPLAGLSAIAGPTGDTGNDGILGLTEVWIYTATYVVTQADVDAGQITNQATVNGLAMNPANTPVTDLSGSSIGTDDATVVVICQDADIAIVKTSDQIPGANNCVDLSEGDTVTYTFTVTNQGNLSIDNVVVTDPLAGLSAIAGPTGDTGNDGILGLTEVWVYTATYVVTQGDVDAGQITNQATVNGLAMNPANTPVTDLSGSSIGTDDATVVVICQDADIAIVKTSDQIPGANNCVDLSEGDTVTYTFTVTNQGNLSIDNVVVTDPLAGLSAIAGPTGDTGNDGILGLTEVWVYTATYVVTQADVDAGQITNQATVNGLAMNPANTPVTDLSGSTTTTDDPTVITICQTPAIAIVKTHDQIPGANNCVDLSEGDTVTYTFTVTNQGNLSIDNVVVTDPLAGLSAIAGPTGDTGNDGILGLTEVWVYTATYVVTQGDVDAGQITNQATVNGLAMNPANTPVTDLSGSTTTTDDPTVITICQTPAIAIVKTHDQIPGQNNCVDLSEGDTVTYTFTVTNQGNLSIDNVVVTDPLAGLSAIAGPTGDTGNDGILGLTEVWVYTATYVVTQADVDAGQITNQATVNGLAMNPANTPVTDLSGSTTTTDDPTVITICQTPAIAIVKTHDQNPTGGNNCIDLTVNQVITYSFAVTNEGNVSLSAISVVDPLPGLSAITFVSGDADNDGELDLTETWLYTATYTVTQDDIDLGTITNQATATGTPPFGADVSDLSGSTVTTDDPTIIEICQNPAIAIVKAASYDDGGDCSDPGELINYTFTVTNEGNVSLSNIVVTDPLLGGVVAGPDSGDTDNDGELDVTETWIYTGSYAITQDDIDAGEVINQATATGIAPDQSQVSDLSGSTTTTDDATTTELCQNPAIAIVKAASYDDGGDCSDPGELINYTFTVTNEGNVSLSNIVVTDPLLGGVVAGPDSGDTDNDGELDVTETWIYTGSYAITQDDIDAGEVINQATATGIAPDQSQVSDLSGSTTTTDDATTTELCQNPAIAIVKAASYDDGGDCSDPGELINYTFTVTNEGNVSLSNIVVTDPLLGGVVAGPDSGDTDNDGELDVTETWIYTGSYAITQDDIDAGEVINQATATGVAPDQSQVSDLSGSTTTTDDATTTELCQNPAIAIVKAASYDDGGDCSDPGELINYTFTVTNEGNVSLSNIVVTDPLLGGVVAGPDSGDTDNDGELDVTETWIYTGSYAITQDDIDAGEVINQATATGIAPDQSQVSDLSGSTTTTDDATTTELCQNPAIAIVKAASYDDGGDCSDPGELINYTFTVTNEGNVSLSNIVVTDPLLGGVVAGPDSGDTDNDGELDVTETWIYTGSYAITQDDIDAGEVINQATATGIAPDQSQVSDLSGSTTTTDDATTTELCQNPAIAIVKAASYDDGGDCSDPGELINYTFTVTNEGNVSLSNIVVTDPLLGGVVAGPDSGDTDNDGELDVTETWIYTGSYAITQDDIDAGEVINQATATGIAPDQSQVSDLSGSTTTTDDATTTELCQNPAIAIVKAASYDDGGDCSDPGELINYTFTVTNEGNVSLSNIVVTDPLLGGVVAGPDSGDTDNDGELDVTETWIYTGSYAITQDDIDAGEVINQATATGIAPDQSQVSDLSGSTTTTDDATTTELCQNPAIAIVKAASYDDGGDCSDPGELINYTFTVTNEGNVSLSNIVVTDPLLGGVVAGPDSGDTDNDGELDVTETWIYTGSYAITQDDIDAGEVINQATATGIAPDQSQVSDLSGSTTTTDDATTTELCQNPAIAIVKAASYDDGGDCSDPGELINYTFTVTNEGNVSLSNIVVTDPLLGGVVAGPDSGDTDNDGELDVTETWIYTGSYAITQDDIDAGEVINQATATGIAPDQSQVSDLSGSTTTTDDATTTELCQEAIIAIVKTGLFIDDDGDKCADVGEFIDYTFTVTNEGNVSLANIEVNDPLVGGQLPGPDSGDTDGDNELDVTETWIYTASYAITQDDIDAGEVINQATAKGTDPSNNTVFDLSDDNSVLEDDPTITDLCQEPVIAIIKTGIYNDDDQDGCADVDETIDYTFAVTNEGNVSLSNIVVTDPLLGGVIAGPDSGDTDNDGELDVTEMWIYTASYLITQADIDAGEVVNQATAEGTAPDATVVTDLSDDNSVLEDDPTITDLCQQPAIALIKTGLFIDDDGDKCADVDETIDYTFTVFNLGNVSLSNIVVNDPLLGGPIAGPDSGDTDNDGELDVTETWVYTATYIITQADIDAGQVTNQATAEGTAPDATVVTDLSDDNSTVEDDPTITDLCQNPVIAIIKVGTFNDDNDNNCADIGESIDYVFTVTNEGNMSLSSVVVDDPLLGGPIAGPDSGDTDGNGELGENETWIYTASYVITQADIDAGEVVNQAIATAIADGDTVSDLSDDNSVLEDDPTITDLCQNARIALEKVGIFNDENGNSGSDVGETISYFFTVTNTGSVTLYNITISDPLPGIIIEGGPIAQLDPGEVDSTTFTATYVITQADIDAGEVINQATVTGEDGQGGLVTDDSDDPVNTDDVDNNGDGDPDDPTVVILPNVLPANFEIFNGVTPDGDGLNDYFQIDGIENWPINNVKIFNRWGVLVWETDGYGVNGNVFRGESNGRSTIREEKALPTGTYYYILTFPGDNPGQSSYSGYLYINR